MLYLLIKSYLHELTIVFGSCAAFFLVGLYFIFKPKKINPACCDHSQDDHSVGVSGFSATDDDYVEFAGEDVLATHLDLARAYIEAGQSESASELLKQVLSKGNEFQQQEAQQLLTKFSS